METAVIILSGILITVIAGIIGKSMGTSNKVSEETCAERRDKYNDLILAKFKAVEDRLDLITTMLQALTNAKVFEKSKD